MSLRSISTFGFLIPPPGINRSMCPSNPNSSLQADPIAFDDIHITTASRTSKIFAVEQVLDLRCPGQARGAARPRLRRPRYGDQRLVEPEGPAFKEAKDAEGSGARNRSDRKDPLGRDARKPARRRSAQTASNATGICTAPNRWPQCRSRWS